MTKILYNNVDIFSGISPVPFVAIDGSSDGFDNNTTKITLNGEIICCGLTVQQIQAKQVELIRRLSKNYQSFEITQSNSKLLSAPHSYIQDITFDESSYSFSVPYSIVLEAYRNQGALDGYFIKNPVNKFTFEDGDNKSINIIHEVSAIGCVSDKSAIENAQNWVQNQTGWVGAPTTAFISMHDYNPPTLVSINERINRLNGSYSVIENYVFDQHFTGMGLLRYKTDISYDKFDFTNVQINGELLGGKSVSLPDLRNRFKGLNLWNLAFNDYYSVSSTADLNSIPITNSITENQNENKIIFNAAYDNNNRPLVYVVTEAEYKNSFRASTPSEASITSTIRCRLGDPAFRLNQCRGYYQNNFDALGEFNYNMVGICNYNLAEFKIKNESFAENHNDGSITYSCSWDVRAFNVLLPCYIYSINYSITKQYGRQKYVFEQPLCESWNAYGTHIAKPIISIKGQAQIQVDTFEQSKRHIQSLLAGWMPNGSILKVNEYTDDSANGTLSFNIELELL